MIIQFLNKDASFAFQGTAAVVLAGLVASLKVTGGTLADHTFLFLGAGEVNPGVCVNHANDVEMNYFTPIENNGDLIFQACIQNF
jgi:malic enzyme